ncbi:hypothetical protein Taro_005549 [Colocasia esculenta]|uniref:Uncharacterized protein n=1 Tax=Colocasia esculenta TaxID=4460 RepID=A0A843TUZ8_COLES|nr:hypothetical protein [Colocasia esculenta]
MGRSWASPSSIRTSTARSPLPPATSATLLTQPLQQLWRLQLELNLLNGTFPKELGGLAKLEYLSLGGNPFRPPMALPAEFGNLGRASAIWPNSSTWICR